MAGVIGGITVDGKSAKELWWMYTGKMESIRQQVLWQTDFISRSLTKDAPRVDFDDFVRRGALGSPHYKVTMSDELRAKVEVEQGRMNQEMQEAANG